MAQKKRSSSKTTRSRTKVSTRRAHNRRIRQRDVQKISYKFESLYENFPPKSLHEIKNQISKSIPFLEKNLDRLLDYLKKEDNLNNYIEINLPLFDSNLSYKINLYYGKIIISVMKHDDTLILGHLLIDGYDCLDKNGIEELGLNMKVLKGKNIFHGLY